MPQIYSTVKNLNFRLFGHFFSQVKHIFRRWSTVFNDLFSLWHVQLQPVSIVYCYFSLVDNLKLLMSQNFCIETMYFLLYSFNEIYKSKYIYLLALKKLIKSFIGAASDADSIANSMFIRIYNGYLFSRFIYNSYQCIVLSQFFFYSKDKKIFIFLRDKINL